MAISLEFGFVEGNNGYIVVSANGGINQQRVAVSSVSGRIFAFMNIFIIIIIFMGTLQN